MPAQPAPERFPPPEGLDARGTRLWEQLGAGSVDDAGTRVVIEEACRVVDRLERLDGILRGDGETWAQLAHKEDGTIIVQLGSTLAEARQQQVTLQRLIAAVQVKLEAAGGATQGGSIFDELRQRREAGGRPEAPRRADTRGR